MKYIITENQKDKLIIMRRLPELKSLIRNLFPFQYPCDFDSLIQYMMAIKIEMFETIVLDWFEGIDNELIWDITSEIYRDDMVENYINNCKD